MPIIFILAATATLYLSIFLNPDLLLNRGNDLQEQFWPVFHFIKQAVVEYKTLPLWNNLFFSGTPLLPDPQFPLFYPPYVLFILFPTDILFVLSLFFHSLLGGLGIYLVGRYALAFSKEASLFSAVLYLASPRLAGYLEAGHPGLVVSHAWIPFALLGIMKLVKTPSFLWSLLLAISLAGIFYSHTVTLLLVLATLPIVFLASIFFSKKGVVFKSFFLLSLSFLLLFGLIAITLLPQLDWAPQTTRFLLLQDRDVYPKWTSFKEFLQATFWPWIFDYRNSWNLDTEKWITLGVIPTVFAAIGFLRLKRSLQFLTMGVIVSTSLIALNTLSPIYSFLISQDFFVLMRVATRIWFVVIILVVLLAGHGFQSLLKKNRQKKLIFALGVLALAELTGLFWFRLLKPIPEQTRFVPQEVYEFIKRDADKFRVFCINRCLSQKEAAKYRLELVEGYNTLSQINYYRHMWQLTQSYWNYYTLSLPPIGTYTFEEIQPDASSLGAFNVKYVISPHPLKNKGFVLEKKIDNYFIYRNILIQPRAYFWSDEQKSGDEAKILHYSPNFIKIDASFQETNHIVLAEVWSPGWKAYLNGKEEVLVQEKPDTLRLVDIKPDTKFVDFKYQPTSYRIGRIITFSALFLLLVFGVKKWKEQSAS